jgi:hypothetical protein
MNRITYAAERSKKISFLDLFKPEKRKAAVRVFPAAGPPMTNVQRFRPTPGNADNTISR